MALKKRTEGVFSEDMKPGSLVFDNAEATGEPLKDFAFTAYGKDYETDENGALIATVPTSATDSPKFLNPLDAGVSYKDFVAQLDATDSDSIKEHLATNVNADFDSDTVNWIVREVEHFLKK